MHPGVIHVATVVIRSANDRLIAVFINKNAPQLLRGIHLQRDSVAIALFFERMDLALVRYVAEP